MGLAAAVREWDSLGFLGPALVSTLLGACASQPVGPLAPAMTPPGVQFSVEQKSYRLGDTISVVLTNESDRTLVASLCLAIMEREGAEGWEHVSRRSPTVLPLVCVGIGSTLWSGTSRVGDQRVIREMEAGVYRFRIDADWGDIETVLMTNEFRIVR